MSGGQRICGCRDFTERFGNSLLKRFQEIIRKKEGRALRRNHEIEAAGDNHNLYIPRAGRYFYHRRPGDRAARRRHRGHPRSQKDHPRGAGGDDGGPVFHQPGVDDGVEGRLAELGHHLAAQIVHDEQVASEVFFTLQHWKEFVNVTDDNRNLFRCSVFIRRLFVNPNYRNMGVASFTLDHLDEFIYKKYGLNLTYVCTIVPSIYETEMRDVIERTLQNAGFTNIPEERPGDVYAKHYKGK